MLKSTKSKTAPAERLVSILDRNADPNFLHNGYNALHFAAEHGSAEWVKVLLEYDANVQITTKARSETALHLATWQNDIDVFLEKLQLLRQYEVHLDAQNSDGDTALHLVIRRFRSVEAVEALLSAGASTEIKDRQGRTPLFYALNLEQEEKAMALLDGGANVNCQDETGRSLLHLAIASRRISTDFINRLVCATIDINQPDQNGHTPLFHAVKLNKRDIITLLHHRGGEYGLGNSGPRQGLAQGDWWRRLKLGIF